MLLANASSCTDRPARASSIAFSTDSAIEDLPFGDHGAVVQQPVTVEDDPVTVVQTAEDVGADGVQHAGCPPRRGSQDRGWGSGR